MVEKEVAGCNFPLYCLHCKLLVGLCTIVRGDNNSKVLLMSWYWYAISMNVGAMNVYLGSV